MKKGQYIITGIFSCLFFLILGYVGCKKDVTNKSNVLDVKSIISDYIFAVSQPTDGNINFITQDQVFARYKSGLTADPYYISFSGGFYKNRQIDKYILVGNLIIDGKEIKSNGLAYSIMQFNLQNDTAKWLYSLWGKTINIAIRKSPIILNGNSDTLSTVTANFYLPAAIQIKYTDTALVTVLHKSGQSIMWNVDPNNPSKKVILTIIYDGVTTRTSSANSNMPANDKIILEREIDDTGNYQLTATDLASLPLGCSAVIGIGRGNYAVIPDKTDTTKNVVVSALATSEQPVVVMN